MDETVEDEKINGTGEVTQPKNEEKTFTQDEVNSMIQKRLEKMPSKDELKAFKEWKDSQKTLEEKQAEREIEYKNTLSRNNELENELKAYKLGVVKDDVDYVVYKVSKMEGDFEENLTKFLKDNPKYIGGETKIVKKVSSSFDLSGKTQTNDTNSVMNDLIRSVREK